MRGPKGYPSSRTTEDPIGVLVIDSTPAATAMSYAPAMTPWAAKCTACCDEPHWRSTVVPGTDSGQPAASTALRPMLKDCSATCMTQPMITSSTWAGSSWLRSATALRASDAKSTACQLRSLPLRFPPAVRTASTMTAVVMVSPPNPAGRWAPRRFRSRDILAATALWSIGPESLGAHAASPVWSAPDEPHRKGHGPLVGRRRDADHHPRRWRPHGLRRRRGGPGLGHRDLHSDCHGLQSARDHASRRPFPPPRCVHEFRHQRCPSG